eukprot:PITA_11687
MYFLDGFSGYSQIVVHLEDQEKTAFTSPWGTFMYSKMPFELMNVRDTFQRAMDIAFVGEKDKFVLIYLDDIIVFSNKSSRNSNIVHPKENDEGVEHLVAFFSKTLRDAELMYDVIEKQAYALIKSSKEFKIYILHSKLVSYVPSTSVEDVVTQPNIDEKREKWIAKFIEFNIEVKPTKLVKGQGLAKLMAEENCSLLDINCMGSNSGDEQTEEVVEEQEQNQPLAENLAPCEWADELVDMCESMGIQLVHSTSYYPQGNGLAESSNKSFVRIIKKLLEDNRKSWHSKLKFALWVDRVTEKKSIGNSPFKLVYGTTVVFTIQLILLVAKLFQEEHDVTNDMVRRMNNLVQLQQIREQMVEKSKVHQKKIKEAFDRKVKVDNFQVGDWVLKWDALKEKKGNHGNFDSLWTGLSVITQIQQNNTFILHSLKGQDVFGGPVNGRFLKIYFI